MWAALVAAIAIGVVWAGGERTVWHQPIWGAYVSKTGINAYGVRGGVWLTDDEFYDLFQPSARPPLQWQRSVPPIWFPSWRNKPVESWTLQLPYWLPLLVCLAVFALIFRIERREKRLARAGHCVCGYSLAGLAEGAVCPECGKGNGTS